MGIIPSPRVRCGKKLVGVDGVTYRLISLQQYHLFVWIPPNCLKKSGNWKLKRGV